jgi:nucleoid-associated protein YgaU
MKAALQRRAVVMCGVVVSLLFTCTLTSFAQSLGDIARQERERKNDQPQRKTHVYTNDDLQKPHILVPEDQARALSARTWIELNPAPAVQASERPVPASPGAIPVPPSPAAAKTSLIASSPARVETPSADLPVTRSRPPAVLVSSPTGWKTVHLGTAKDEIALSNAVTRKAVPDLARQPEENSVEANRVRVERGDSLWKLAERHLGSGARWRELAELNPQLSNPDLIRSGDWIHVPTEDARNAKHIVVRSGDSLWSVAHAEFGNGLAFSCIAGANPHLRSVDRIHPGDTLTLPQTCSIAR